jgi:hypothetical protein
MERKQVPQLRTALAAAVEAAEAVEGAGAPTADVEEETAKWAAAREVANAAVEEWLEVAPAKAM